MPPIELVMCGKCGRPQEPADRCVQCGEKLPEPVVPRAPRPKRDQVLDAYEPYLEASVGGGRALALSRKRLEWFEAAGAKPLSVELSTLARVDFRSRPTWEALILGTLFALAAVAWRGVWLQGAFAALAAVAVLACFLQRRHAVVLVGKDGTRRALFVGAGTPNSPSSKRAKSVWETLSAELSALGVQVVR